MVTCGLDAGIALGLWRREAEPTSPEGEFGVVFSILGAPSSLGKQHISGLPRSDELEKLALSCAIAVGSGIYDYRYTAFWYPRPVPQLLQLEPAADSLGFQSSLRILR